MSTARALAVVVLVLPIAAAVVSPVEAARGPLDHAGSWSNLGPSPITVINSALLEDGRVLLYGFNGQSAVWDARNATFAQAPAANTNKFCSGMAFLADGRLLVVGGHFGQNASTGAFLGIDSVEEFDGEYWYRVPDMAGGPRWYPTAVTLADGRVLAHNGVHDGVLNKKAEVYNPDTWSWSIAGERRLSTYARAHVMPDGRVHFTSPEAVVSAFDPANGTWSDGPRRETWGRATAVSVQMDAKSGRTLVFGGFSDDQGVQSFAYDPLARTWTRTPNLAHARTWADGVVLPTGEVFAVGGDRAPRGATPIRAEIYEPATNEWVPVLRPVWQRGYHSTAILLADGSVLSTNQLDRAFEVYKPWYFFVGDRPTIDAAPTYAAYGGIIPIATPDDVRQVVLVRHGSSTHGLDTDQRRVPLDFVSAPGVGVTALVPASRAIAPPGPYTLFVLDANGVPSEGKPLLVEPGFGLVPVHAE